MTLLRALLLVLSTLAMAGSANAAAREPRCAPEPPVETRSFSLLSSLPLRLVLLAGDGAQLFGSASMGTPTRGSLWGGVELHEGPEVEVAGGYHWGTELTVRSLERAAREVRRCLPGGPRVIVGDIAREHGGWLRPHRSHQSGLDADVGYVLLGPSTWYQRPTAATLDGSRTWTLVRSLIEGGHVDTIFIDASVQALLKTHLATLPPEEQPGEGVFRTATRRDAIIQHAWGHASHLHVRFRDPDARRLGERIARLRGKR